MTNNWGDNEMSEIKNNKEVFIKPLNADNPILVQVLGICSALSRPLSWDWPLPS